MEPNTVYEFSIKVKGEDLSYALLDTPSQDVTINVTLESLPATVTCKTQDLVPQDALTPEKLQQQILERIAKLEVGDYFDVQSELEIAGRNSMAVLWLAVV